MKCYDGINLFAEGHRWWLFHTSFSGVRHDFCLFFPSLEAVFYWMLHGPARASCHHKADTPIGVGFYSITRWCNLGWDAAIYTVAKGFFLFLFLLSLPPFLALATILASPSGSSDSFQTLEKGHILFPNRIRSRTAISFLIFRQNPTFPCSFPLCFQCMKG